MPTPVKPPSPFHSFSVEEWSALKADEPMTLTAADVERLRALNDPISLIEAEQVYLPLTRLLSLYVEAVQGLHSASMQFLGRPGGRVPFIIGVAGSVAVGKSTTSRILRALLRRWPSSPRVELVTTDGFLFPNALLEERGIMQRKGFPESYDRTRFITFLSDVKSGAEKLTVPTYSHLVYDVVPGGEMSFDKPDILIVEGLNILQPGDLSKSGRPILFASDFLDFSVFIDADLDDLQTWYVARFMKLRETAFRDPNSFFKRFTLLSEQEAIDLAVSIWQGINLPNLTENILPTRSRADLIVKKGRSHGITDVMLRRV